MGRVRFLPAFFMAGVAFECLRSVAATLWERFVVLPYSFPNSSGPLPQEALQFGVSAIQLAISPCLLFVALYFLGKEIDLRADLGSLAVSLGPGGVAGTFIGILTSSLLLGAFDLSGYLQYLASLLGDVWALALLLAYSIGDGLYSFFVGVAAVFIANLRTPSLGGKAGAPAETGSYAPKEN